MAMIYKINYLPIANQDILDIDQYLSQFYPSTPVKFFKELDKKIKSLQNMPRIGQKYKQYRCLVFNDYLVFYKVVESEKSVEIYRIIHSSRDIKNYL